MIFSQPPSSLLLPLLTYLYRSILSTLVLVLRLNRYQSIFSRIHFLRNKKIFIWDWNFGFFNFNEMSRRESGVCGVGGKVGLYEQLKKKNSPPQHYGLFAVCDKEHHSQLWGWLWCACAFYLYEIKNNIPKIHTSSNFQVLGWKNSR